MFDQYVRRGVSGVQESDLERGIPMSNHDYYHVMGLNVDVSDDEIRKAYKRMALECHPDHHPADPASEERFKLVSEAYSILGDAEKRREYDLRYRRAGDRNNIFDQADPDALFRNFRAWQGFGGHGCLGHCGWRGSGISEDGLIYVVSLTREEAVCGARKEIIIPTRGGKSRSCRFRIPPGVESGTQFRLVLDRSKGIFVFLRINIVGSGGEATADLTKKIMG
jgi:DnaJ-class molecular chaperone